MDYSKFYNWEPKRSKILEIAVSAQKYFTEHSPFVSKETILLDSTLEKVEENVVKPLEQINLAEVYSNLS